jgi:hypothetical protein
LSSALDDIKAFSDNQLHQAFSQLIHRVAALLLALSGTISRNQRRCWNAPSDGADVQAGTVVQVGVMVQ